MNEWNPHSLCSCLDSVVVARTMAVLNAGVIVLYTLIGRRWIKAAWCASSTGFLIWMALMFIFLGCSMTGYGSDILKLWFPRTGVLLRLGLLMIQWVVCILFLIWSSDHVFIAQGANERIGESIADAVADGESDESIGKRSRELVAELLPDKLIRLSQELSNQCKQGAV